MEICVLIESQLGPTYDEQLRFATASEQLGFHGFFRTDHYLSTGYRSRSPGPTDAWVTLGALARETSAIRLGTLVTPITFRLPGPLAISVAQVDAMSAGRVELGLGAGWHAAEHSAYGINFPEMAERYTRFTEQIEIIDGLLTTSREQPYNYAGQYYALTNSPALPEPVQRPRPPIILGGAGRQRGAALAAQFADEYNVGFRSAAVAAQTFERVRAAAAETGRRLRYSVAHVAVVGRNDAEVDLRASAIGLSHELRGHAFVGSPARVVEHIGEYAALGVSRIYLQCLDLTDIDHLELIASTVLTQL